MLGTCRARSGRVMQLAVFPTWTLQASSYNIMSRHSFGDVRAKTPVFGLNQRFKS
jgi:hypothetical protein